MECLHSLGAEFSAPTAAPRTGSARSPGRRASFGQLCSHSADL